MALKNYLIQNSYIHIKAIWYEPIAKRCTAHVDIYKDNERKILLANTSVMISGESQVEILESFEDLRKKPPEIDQESIKKVYIIAEDAEDSWTHHDGMIARYNLATKSWDKYSLTDFSFMKYVEDKEDYYLFTNGKWEKVPEVGSDKKIWDKWMAPEVAMAEGTNPTRQMYKFMKTLERFKDCEDC